MTGKISDLAPNTNDKRKEEYIITGSISACKPPIYDGNCFESQRSEMSNYDGKIESPSQWYHNQGDAKYTSYEKPDTYLWLAEENDKLKKRITELKVRLLDSREARDNATKVANTYLDQFADLSKKVERLQEQLKEANDLLKAFYDDSPCRFDHHGYCQEHGSTDGNYICVQGELKEYLERYGVK